MKIEYDVSLYIEMANFSVNEVVQVSNRKGRRSTIHITNITKLSWQDLQLLVSSGADKFSKMVMLYREYSSKKEVSESVIRGKSLSLNETSEINEYIKIFRDHGCTKHHEVNEIIAQRDEWDSFKTIRSLNDHGKHKEIEGIQPQYFEIICNILKISGEQGLPLDSFQKY
ncbi:MAG: hypothetical protein L3K25_05840 [Gammaproteobacteria bacterium]|nr:hypothetical protein [Gammaproteobacteria bacterium]